MRYTFRVRKRDYYNVWFAEMLEDGVVVRRYDFPSEAEAQAAIMEWKHYQIKTHNLGDKDT